MLNQLSFILSHPKVTIRAFKSTLNSLMADRLSVNAISNGSDKGINSHGYTRIYRRLFDSSRLAVKSFLEIGLLRDDAVGKSSHANTRAPSLQAWADYFPNAGIIGFDICDFSGFQHPRCMILQGDQGNPDDLQRLSAVSDVPFDAIIDDGSHASSHQQLTLGVLLPMLSRGGVYIIEDLHWQPKEFEKETVPKTIDLLRRLQRGENFCSPVLSERQNDYITQCVDRVMLFDSLRTDIPGFDALAVIQTRK